MGSAQGKEIGPNQSNLVPEEEYFSCPASKVSRKIISEKVRTKIDQNNFSQSQKPCLKKRKIKLLNEKYKSADKKAEEK